MIRRPRICSNSLLPTTPSTADTKKNKAAACRLPFGRGERLDETDVRVHAAQVAARHLCPGGAEITITAMGDSRVSLTHHFLIAMPSMADPHFAHTLIYICEHNDQGALGVVVNKPIDMTLSALFEQINIPL